MRTAASLLLVALALPRAEAGPETGQETDWIVTLDNGDILHCRLHAIEAGRLVVTWAIAPEAPLRLDLSAVAQVVRAGEEGRVAEAPANQDVLRLQDDSILYGRAAAIAPTGVEFDVPQVGRLHVPAADIVDLQRGRQEIQVPDAKDGEFAVALRSGVALTGKLLADDRGRLVLEGAGLTASIEYESLAVLVFPRPAPRTEEVDVRPVAGIEIRLRSGSVVSGRDPTFEDGIFRLRTGGVDASVPAADITAISFQDYGMPVGRSGLRAILAWGRWSDPGEEFRRTVDIAKAETKGRWRIVESTTEKYDDEFRRQLFGARTLLIPEMENLKAPSPDATEMKPILETFLRTGGNVVVCGAQAPQQLQWLKDAGLVDLDPAGQVDGGEVAFTPKGAAAGKGLQSFLAMNATNTYFIRSRDAVAFAETGGKAVVVGRRVGRGWVIVVGPDYYMSNEGSSKLLGNVIQLR